MAVRIAIHLRRVYGFKGACFVLRSCDVMLERQIFAFFLRIYFSCSTRTRSGTSRMYLCSLPAPTSQFVAPFSLAGQHVVSYRTLEASYVVDGGMLSSHAPRQRINDARWNESE